MSSLINVIHTVLSIYSLAIILRSFLSMLVDPYHPVANFIRQITEPVLAPIRRIVPPVQAGGGCSICRRWWRCCCCGCLSAS